MIMYHIFNIFYMKYLLFHIYLCFLCSTVYGQRHQCNCIDDPWPGSMLEEKLTCLVLPAAGVVIPNTEPFGRWRYGKIILNSGEIISEQFMHYDGYADQLIINSKNSTIKLAIEKYTVQGFEIESFNADKILSFRRVNVKEKYSAVFHDVFLQVLLSGKNTLYASRKLIKTPVSEKIVSSYSYFIRREDGSMATFVKPTRRAIMSLLPEHKELFLSRLREQHNSVRDEAHLIQAIELFNAL